MATMRPELGRRLVSAEELSRYSGAHLRKAWGWVHLLGTTAVAQGLIQLLGFGVGVLIIRALTPTQYALYVLSLTMVGTITVLADSGVTAGVLAEGGKKWRDPVWLGQAIATGRMLRFRFARISAVVLVPIAGGLLRKHGASWPMVGLLVLAIFASFITALNSGLYSIAPALHQRVFANIRISLWQCVIRLGLTALLLWVWPNAFVAITAAALAQFLVLGQVKKLGAGIMEQAAKANEVMEANILAIVRKRFPECLYYCFSSQITIWLATYYGSTSLIAEVGALTRIGQVMSVLSSVGSVVLIPRFARLENQAGLIIKRYIQSQLILCICIGAACGLAKLFAKQCLWLLGPAYGGLSAEVLLVVLGSGMNVLSGAALALSTARGYVPNPVIYIAVNILWQALCVKWLNVGSVTGMLEFGIAIPALNFVILSGYVVYSAYGAEAADNLV